ncbi:MAG TPA: nitroreductase [Micromonosporaceae bacterium]
MSKVPQEVLSSAAHAALRAPSVFNTQPWHWRVDGDVLRLSADRGRQLPVTDPMGRLLLLSCGAALHHARVAVAAEGWRSEVHRLPEGERADVLAELTLAEPAPPTSHDLALFTAISTRRTDRRPYGDQAVSEEALAALRVAAEAEGTYLHRIRLDQMPMLAIAVARASAQELADPRYRDELTRWANRPNWSGDGVPPETSVQRVPRRVPVREFVLRPNQGMAVSPGGDRGALYTVLFGDGDSAADWLRAGEALSAVLLAAVTWGLATAPISDVIEVASSRELVRRLLAGLGYPYLVVRIGHGGDLDDLARAPRRVAAEVIWTGSER